MKKIILPLACALVFFTCSCNSNSTKSGLLDEEVYENPHMPDDEAQKYGHMMNLLEDLDAMTKRQYNPSFFQLYPKIISFHKVKLCNRNMLNKN